MKKIIIVAIIPFFIGACSGESKDSSASHGDEQETHDEEVKDAKKEQTPSNSFLSSIVGEWTCDAATAGVQIDLEIKDDGTIVENLGGTIIDLKYEVISDNSLKVVNKDPNQGQTWEFTEIESNSMKMCWNPESDKPKTIPFTRK